MKKLTKLALSCLLAGSTLSAYADLGLATSYLPTPNASTSTSDFSYWIVDGGYATNSTYSYMFVKFEEEVEWNNNSTTIDLLDNETNVKAGSITVKPYLGTNKTGNPASSQTLMFDCYSSTSGMTKGKKYKFTLPAGYVKSVSGQESNQEQTFTFIWASGAYLTTAANYNPQPTAISSTSYSGYYSADDLKEVTYYDPSYTFDGTGNPESLTVFALNKATDTTETISYQITDGKLVYNLSTLGEGTWWIYAPCGLYHYSNTSGTLYANTPNATVQYQIMSEDDLEPLPTETQVYGYTIGTALPTYNTSFPSTINVSWNGQPIKLASNPPAVTLNLDGQSYDCNLAIGSRAVDGNTLYALTVTPATTPTLAGIYTLDIPEGVVMSGTYSNAATTVQIGFTPATSAYTITPAPGSVSIDGFDAITIEFTGASSIVPVEGLAISQPTLKFESETTNLTVGDNMRIEGNEVIIPIENAAVGTYTLTIPASTFLIDNKNLNASISQQAFNVWNGLNSAIVVDGPQPFAGASSKTYWTTDLNLVITWDYAPISFGDTTPISVSATYSSSSGSGSIILTEDEGLELVTVADANGVKPESPNALSLSMSEKLMEDISTAATGGAAVTITVPQGLVQNGSELVNPAQTFAYYVYPALSEEATFTVTEAAAEGQYYATWEGINYVTTTEGNAYIKVIDEAGNETRLTSHTTAMIGLGKFYAYMSGGDAGKILFDISNLPNGIYTVEVPTAAFKFRTPDGGTSAYFTNLASSAELTVGTPITVNLALAGENLPGDAYNYVTVDRVIDASEGLTEVLEFSSNSYALEILNDTDVVITPAEGYVVKSIVSDNAEYAGDELIQDLSGFYYVTLPYNEDFDNMTITVTVMPVPKTEVTLNFTADAEANLDAEAYTYVAVSYEELSSGLNDTLSIAANPYTFTVTPIATITFEPKEGYQIVSLQPAAASTSVEVTAAPTESPEGQWSVNILEGEDAVTLNIVVIDSETAGILGINADTENAVIYNMQGVRVNGKNLEKGIYIINGKKVVK